MKTGCLQIWKRITRRPLVIGLICIGLVVAIWVWTRPRTMVLVEEHQLALPITDPGYDDILFSAGPEIAGLLCRTDGYYHWAPGFGDDRLLTTDPLFYTLPVYRSSLSPNSQYSACVIPGKKPIIESFHKKCLEGKTIFPVGKAIFISALDTGEILCLISYGMRFELLLIKGNDILHRVSFPRPTWLTRTGLWTARFSPDGQICIIADATHFGYYSLKYDGSITMHCLYVAKEPPVKWPYPDKVVNQPVMMEYDLLVSQNSGVYNNHGLIAQPDGWHPAPINPPGATAILQYRWNNPGQNPFMKRDLRVFSPRTRTYWTIPGQRHRFSTITPDGRFALVDEYPSKKDYFWIIDHLQGLPVLKDVIPDPTYRLYLSFYERPGRLRARLPLDFNGLSWYYTRKHPWKRYELVSVMLPQNGRSVYAVARKTGNQGSKYYLLLRFK